MLSLRPSFWLLSLFLPPLLLFLFGSSVLLARGSTLLFKKQLVFTFAGFVIFWLLAYKSEILSLKEAKVMLLLAYFILVFSLLVLLVIGEVTRGIKGWFKIGPFSFDPVEPLKIVLTLLWARFFATRQKEMHSLWPLVYSGIYLLVPSLLILFQPDLGSVFVLFLLWLGVLFLSGARSWQFVIVFILVILSVFWGWNTLLQDYQRERVLVFIGLKDDPLGIGWSQRQAKIAVSHGELLGKGLSGATQVRLGYLPAPHTDFVFPAIVEIWGAVGALVVLLLVSWLIWTLITLSLRAYDTFVQLYLLFFAWLIFVETAVNLASSLGFLPVIGVPFPFLSYGGSLVLFHWTALGLAGSVLK